MYHSRGNEPAVGVDDMTARERETPGKVVQSEHCCCQARGMAMLIHHHSGHCVFALKDKVTTPECSHRNPRGFVRRHCTLRSKAVSVRVRCTGAPTVEPTRRRVVACETCDSDIEERHMLAANNI